MAKLISTNLPPEPGFPSEFPYEVVNTLLPSYRSVDDDSVHLDYDLFFPELSQRKLTHSSIFNGVPTRRLAKYSSYRCEAIPMVKKLSVSPNSTFGGTNNWSTPAGVSQLLNSSLIPIHSFDADRFDLVHAAVALRFQRLKVAPKKPHFETCRPDKSSSFRHLPEQDWSPSSLNRDPFSLPCFDQSTMHRQNDALLLGQQRQLRIQAQLRAKKLGFAEGTKAGPLGNMSGSVRGCAGTGVFLPRGPEWCKTSGSRTFVGEMNNANVQDQVQPHGRDELLIGRRNEVWMRLHHHHHHHQHLMRLPES